MEEVHEDDMEPERKKLKVESVETVKGINRLFVYCKAATLFFLSGRGLAISPAKEGKSGFIYNLVKS